MIIKKAQGCYIEDDKKNFFIDTSMGSGAQIIGHGNELAKRAGKQISNGTIYSIPNEHTLKVSQLLKQHINPGLHDNYIYCSTGTEANMRACRMARAYTGKDIIGRFHGGWHGGLDGFLEDHPDSKGVPKAVNNLIKILPYNDESCFQQITSDFAAVIIEPVQGSNPRSDIKDFLQKLRNRCNETGTLLILDEVMTGFRLSMKGGAGLFDIKPDIVTYGKVLGGGFPIGVVGGKTEIMSTNNVFYGGTFSANPLSMHAAELILQTIIDQNLIQYDKLNQAGEHFRNALNQHFLDKQKPLKIMGCGPLNRIIFTNKFIKNRKERDEYESQNQLQFYEELKKRGVFVNTNRLFHFSMCHTQNIVDEIVNKIMEIEVKAI